MCDEPLLLEGKNAVLEALNHSKPIDKIFVKKGYAEGSLKPIVLQAHKLNIIVQEVDKSKLDSLAQSRNHQGVIALCPAHEYSTVEDILQIAKAKQEAAFIMILDGITDPHNFGAILRTADAFGVHGVVIPKRRSVTLSGVVSKTSAGAIEHVPVARVSNLVNTMEKLKTNGLWIGCADMFGTAVYESNNISGGVAIVIGSEGFGVSRLVREHCDFNISIPMRGKVQSLNASVAASIIMYEIYKRR